MEELTIRVVAQIEEAKRQIATVQSLAEKAGSKQYRVTFRANYAEMRKQTAQIRQTLVELERQAQSLGKRLRDLLTMQATASPEQQAELIKQIVAEADKYERLTESIRETKSEQKMLNAQMAESSAEMRKNAVEADAFGVAYRRARTNIAQLGSQLQSAGRSLTSFSNTFTRFFSGAIMGAGYQAFNKLMSGFSGAFDRADTFATYEKILNVMGYDASKKFAIGTNEERTALENLEQSVLGLPTGLDEIVESMKGYLAVSGDMEKATQAAIAANNTFLASGTDSRNKNRARKQLNNLLAGTELTSQRWQAIVESMPLAVDAVGKELGYKGEEALKEFRKKILGKEIGEQEFLDAFLRVGTTGVIAEATNEMKHTYSAAFANWENATKRMGANILDTLSDTLKSTTGKDLIDYLNDVKEGINGISAEIQDWIKANPDKILEVFEYIKRFNVVDMLKGAATAIGDIASIMKNLAPNFDASKFGSMVIWAGAIGRVLTLTGGIVKGLATPGGALVTLLKGWNEGSGLMGLFRNMSRSKKAIEGAADAAEAATSAGKAVGRMGISWEGVASKAVSIAAIPAIAGSVWLGAKALQEIDKVELNWGHLLNTLGQMGVAITAIGALAAGLGALMTSSPIGWITTLGVGAGLGAILGITGTMVALTEAMDKIATAKIPDTRKMDEITAGFGRIIPAIKNVVDQLAGNKGIIVGWTKKSEAKSAKSIIDSFSGILDSFLSMTKSLNKLSKQKNLGTKLQTAADNIMEIGTGLLPLKAAINKAFGSYEQNFVEQGGQIVRKTFDETAASEYETMLGAIAGIFTNIGLVIDNLKKMRKKLNSIKDGKNAIDFGKFRQNLSNMIHEISLIIMGDGSEDNLYTLGQKAKWVNEGGITNLSNSFYSLGVMVERLRDFALKVNGYNMDAPIMVHAREGIAAISDLAQRMVNVDTFPNASYLVTKLQNLENALDEMAKIPNKIFLLNSMLSGGLQQALENVQRFFTAERFKNFEDIIVSVHVMFDVNMGDALETVYNEVTAKWESIGYVIDTMNLEKERTVTVKFNPDVDPTLVIEAINDAHRRINKALEWTFHDINRTVTVNLRSNLNRKYPDSYYESSGGLIGKPLYRAVGGDIFKPRGTDIVPAMLTPGEWVMRNRAVKFFGTQFMERINALDISGAIRTLHAKIGNNMLVPQRTIVNNTDNRTYNNTQHINTNNPNFAFRRSRWVSELR